MSRRKGRVFPYQVGPHDLRAITRHSKLHAVIMRSYVDILPREQLRHPRANILQAQALPNNPGSVCPCADTGDPGKSRFFRDLRQIPLVYLNRVRRGVIIGIHGEEAFPARLNCTSINGNVLARIILINITKGGARLLCKAFAQLRRSIGRAVVHDKPLEVTTRLTLQKSEQPRQGISPVVTRGKYRNQRPSFRYFKNDKTRAALRAAKSPTYGAHLLIKSTRNCSFAGSQLAELIWVE